MRKNEILSHLKGIDHTDDYFTVEEMGVSCYLSTVNIILDNAEDMPITVKQPASILNNAINNDNCIALGYQHSQSSTNRGGPSRYFTDNEIADFNETALTSTTTVTKEIVRKSGCEFLFKLRNPVPIKRIYCNHNGEAQLFDLTYERKEDSNLVLIKDDRYILRSILIRIKDNNSKNIEDAPFEAFAFSDENGSRKLIHPNVNESSATICLGTLAPFAKLGKVGIADISVLLEGMNMTSAYRNIELKDSNNNTYNTGSSDAISRLVNRKLIVRHKHLGEA